MRHVFRLGVAVALVIGFLAEHGDSILSQGSAEQVWLAGRYDRTRVVVYFETAQFHGALRRSARHIDDPAAPEWFLPPEALPNDSLTPFQEAKNVERFSIGDRYDLLLDKGHVATVTLTTLVVGESDEAVGNQSYMGALATVASKDLGFFTRNYYALRRPEGTRPSSATSKGSPTVFASLRNEPIPATARQRIALLVREWVNRSSRFKCGSMTVMGLFAMGPPKLSTGRSR
jgi:hypothetical protein